MMFQASIADNLIKQISFSSLTYKVVRNSDVDSSSTSLNKLTIVGL